MDPLTVTIIGGLVVSGVTGAISYAKGKANGKKQFQMQCEANIIDYAKALGDKIKEAKTIDDEDFNSFIVKAKAAVSQRNDFEADLEGLVNLLNSDFDKLSKFVKIDNESDLRGLEPEMRRLVAVINEKWDGKAPLISSRIRSLLAKLGIFAK